MRIRARVKRDNRGVITAAERRAAGQAVVEVAEDALTESNDRVPYEEGALARSGEVHAFPEQRRAAITYDTPYAVKQHEDPTLRHPRQGEHHWLENTVESNAERYFEHIAARIRDALG